MKPTVRTTLQALSVAALAIWTILLFPHRANSFKYHFEEGQPWGYGLVTAQYDFPIYKSDAQLLREQQEVLSSFAPCYTLLGNPAPSGYYVVDKSEMDRLTALGCKQISVIYKREATAVPLSKVLTPRAAYQLTNTEWAVNLQYDSLTSEQVKSSLLSSISLTEGMVQTGEKIIDTGEVIDARTYRILDSLRRESQQKSITHKQAIFSMIGIGVMVLVLLFLFHLYLTVFRTYLLRELNHTLFFVILMGTIISAAFLLLRYAPQDLIYLIPFAWVPIITRVFYDSRTALFIHIITTLIVSPAVSAPYLFIVMQITTGMIAIAVLRDMTQRSQLARSAMYVFITYCVVYTAMILIISGDIREVHYTSYIWFFVNAILLICSYGVIFLFERAFNLVSNITLVELTNVNSGLLLRFAEKAPGTFQHSLQVSNLATEAAKRIGAKVLLVRTGALYHDIGKMEHPEYFTENQSGAHNPLLTMTPLKAARTIIAHTAKGVEMAKKHHLPEVIIHFIQSHHGNSIARYFYHTALNLEAAKPQQEQHAVKMEDFRYPGPKPMTKEAAILMMADAIEARSRSLETITCQTINEMVDQMIDQQVSDGQFSETPLSFKDLEEIRQVFKQKLLEMNHHRISYPELALK